MNPYSSLSEAERIRQIGELLATAAIRYLEEQPLPPGQSQQRPPAAPILHVWDLVDDEVEKQVLRYLSVHVGAMPVELSRALNVSSMTLTRRLARLREAGLIMVSGKTRSTVYSLAADTLRN